MNSNNFNGDNSFGLVREIINIIIRNLQDENFSEKNFEVNWSKDGTNLILKIDLSQLEIKKSEIILKNLSNYFYNMLLKNKLSNLSAGIFEYKKDIFIYNFSFNNKFKQYL